MKKILFPTEFGPLGEKARETVVWLAEKNQAEVWLLHAVPRTNVVTRLLFGVDPERNEHEAIEQLDDCAKVLNEGHQLEVHPVVGVGKPEKAIVEAAEKQGSELIVLGTKGDEGWLTEIRGTGINYVIQHAPCPVLSLLEKPEKVGFDRILVVSDPAEESLKHVDWAISLGTKVKVLQHYNAHKATYEQIDLEKKRVAQKMKEAGLDEAEIFTQVQGPVPAVDIFSAANEFNADLIVLMEFDWDTEADDDTPVGSLVEVIVEHSSIPVLTVHHGHPGPI